MFDIGWSELMIIGVVALVVIGPRELPGVLRSIGSAMSKLRRMAGEFQGQFQDALREAELDEAKKTISGLNEQVNALGSGFNPLQTLRDEIKGAVEKPADNPSDNPSLAVAPAPDPLPAAPAGIPDLPVPSLAAPSLAAASPAVSDRVAAQAPPVTSDTVKAAMAARRAGVPASSVAALDLPAVSGEATLPVAAGPKARKRSKEASPTAVPVAPSKPKRAGPGRPAAPKKPRAVTSKGGETA
jgi:sec-independent protein translocase protein TatB